MLHNIELFKKFGLKSILIGLFASSLFIGCSGKTATIPQEELIDSLSGGEGSANGGSGLSAGMDGSSSSSDGSRGLSSNGLNSVYFNFDIFSVDSSMEDDLNSNAQTLKNEEYLSSIVKLEGNCDEWGSDEYNYALGLKRAKSIKDYLSSEGVDANKISIISFGESNPICSDKNKECWKKNRRVDTKLLP